MRVSRTILCATILSAIPFPASAQIRALDDVTHAIGDNCKLEGWQFKLEYVENHDVKVELSPTLTQEKMTCAYRTVSDWGFKIAGDVPVALPSTPAPN